MTRPDFTGIRPDIADYITSLEQKTAQSQKELGKRDKRIAQLENSVADITQFQNLQRLYFGRKSEKIRVPALADDGEQLSIPENIEFIFLPPYAYGVAVGHCPTRPAQLSNHARRIHLTRRR